MGIDTITLYLANKSHSFTALGRTPQMKNFFALLILVFSFSARVSAQENYIFEDERKDTVKAVKIHFRIAVFSPLYLDSVFSSTASQASNNVPRFVLPAVEFMQGAQLAMDTIRINGKIAEAFLYDSKSYTKPIPWLIERKMLDSMDLIIGNVKDRDFMELAYFSHVHNIPFISATYPNDGGVINTPGLVIVNSTLKAHCEGILSYLTQKHGTGKIYLIKQKGDNRIDDYFKELNLLDGKPRLNIRTITYDSTITLYSLRTKIDTTVATAIIGGSLNETFARNIADAAFAMNKTHPVTLVGMPNWDGFRSFYRNDVYPDFPIIFTTPHYDGQSNRFKESLTRNYFKLYRTRPSDMAYKGFGLSYYFINLLLAHPTDFLQHLNDKSNAAFHDFLFKPVFVDPAKTREPDYYENKHLYIMRILNGEIGRQW